MICVDASVAFKWLFPEEHDLQARSLLHATVERGEPIVAPPVLPSEITNALRQKVRRGQLLFQDARAALFWFLALPVELHAPPTLYERALVVAVERGLPATYDAQYVVLSELLGATFWTADERLFNATASRMPFVHLLRDFAN